MLPRPTKPIVAVVIDVTPLISLPRIRPDPPIGGKRLAA
jgi:hypothetical protein